MTEEAQEERTFPVIPRDDWQRIAEGYDLSFVEMLHELSAAVLSMTIFLAEQKDVIESIPVELIAADQYKLVVTKRDDGRLRRLCLVGQMDQPHLQRGLEFALYIGPEGPVPALVYQKQGFIELLSGIKTNTGNIIGRFLAGTIRVTFDQYQYVRQQLNTVNAKWGLVRGSKDEYLPVHY